MDRYILWGVGGGWQSLKQNQSCTAKTAEKIVQGIFGEIIDPLFDLKKILHEL